jgi:hypothetical protein
MAMSTGRLSDLARAPECFFHYSDVYHVQAVDEAVHTHLPKLTSVNHETLPLAPIKQPGKVQSFERTLGFYTAPTKTLLDSTFFKTLLRKMENTPYIWIRAVLRAPL